MSRAFASLFALTLLGSTLLTLTARADIAATRGARSLGTTVNGGESCSSGSCRIGGGKARGENLFHRLDRFVTNNGINDVLIENGSAKTVVMGVIGPGRTQITVPVTMQNRAGLMLMSPAGMTVNGAGSFLNVSRLGLTNQTGLKLGNSWFDVLTTTAQELDGPDFAGPIVFERSSLRTSLDSLDEIGLATPGSVEMSDVQLVVERNLVNDIAEAPPPPPTVLIDAGLADLSLSNARITASETLPNSALYDGLYGETKINLYGRTIALNGSSLSATGFSQFESGTPAALFGRMNLQADGNLNLTTSSLQALLIGLRGTNVDLSGSTVSSPRGQIRINASNRISLVEGSRLDVTPQTPADVLGQGRGSVIRDLDPESGEWIPLKIETVPAEISLATSGNAGEGIRISNSILEASNLSKSLQSGIPAIEINPQKMVAGNIFISANSGALEVLNGSRLSASADMDYGGLISLLALDSESSLTLRSSTISASSPNGSADISIFGQGPVNILESTVIEASTTAIIDDGLTFFTNPPEIRISSNSSDGVTINSSTISSRFSEPTGTGPESAFTPFSDYVDASVFDVGDFSSATLGFVGFDIPSGGLIRVTSAGSIAVAGESRMDTSSTSSLAGIIELLAEGGTGINLDSSNLMATIDNTNPNLSSANLHPGRIDLLANNGITVNNSTLDASFKASADTNSCIGPCGGSIQLLSGAGPGAGIAIAGSDLNASASVGAGGSIVLSSEAGLISVANSTLAIGGDPEGTINDGITPVPLSDFTSGTGLFPSTDFGWRLTRKEIIDLELGTSEIKSLPEQQLDDQIARRLQISFDLLIDNRDPTKVRARVIKDAPVDSTQPLAQPTSATFDTTTEEGLKGLSDFLRDFKVDEESIAAVVRTQSEIVRQQRSFQQSTTASTAAALEGTATASQLNIQASITSPSTASTDQASSQQGRSTLQAALTSQVSLSEAQSTASLQEGEEASSAALAELLADGSTPPPVPTLQQLQAMLRQAGLNSTGSKADQAAILRISYAADPQASSAGAGSLDLVLITADGQPTGWRSTIQLAEFRDLLRRYYSDLAEQNLAMDATTPADDAPERRLFELVFGKPMEQLERARIGTLIISADPALIDIPFNALHDGKRYLSQRFSLAITPSLAFTNLTAPDAGRPTSSGQRINAGASLFRNGLTPLPMVEKELAELSLPQSQGQVTTLLNSQFNPSSFSSGFADAGTRQVHIASHAEIAAGPQRIPTIYTGDTALSLRELGQLRQRSGASNLDLVTLSACRSALNGADLELGFAGLAVQLGAKTAIGTKWYVDDVATSSFFVLFYRQLQQGLAKADALRATQQAFASGQVRVESTSVIGPGEAVLLADLPESYQHRYTRGFSHPYYWAGVQLVGSPW